MSQVYVFALCRIGAHRQLSGDDGAVAGAPAAEEERRLEEEERLHRQEEDCLHCEEDRFRHEEVERLRLEEQREEERRRVLQE